VAAVVVVVSAAVRNAVDSAVDLAEVVIEDEVVAVVAVAVQEVGNIRI